MNNKKHFFEDKFADLLELAGLAAVDRAAEFLGVSESSIYRYIRHGAPYLACVALEPRAGLLKGYPDMCFRDDGIWVFNRRIVQPRDLTELEWLLQREFMRGQLHSIRHEKEIGGAPRLEKQSVSIGQDMSGGPTALLTVSLDPSDS